MGNRSILYELNIQLDSGAWGVSCPLDQNLIGPVGYGWDRFQKDPDSFVFGGGLLAGSPLPGTRTTSTLSPLYQFMIPRASAAASSYLLPPLFDLMQNSHLRAAVQALDSYTLDDLGETCTPPTKADLKTASVRSGPAAPNR